MGWIMAIVLCRRIYHFVLLFPCALCDVIIFWWTYLYTMVEQNPKDEATSVGIDRGWEGEKRGRKNPEGMQLL
jgi:hypothetical protein